MRACTGSQWELLLERVQDVVGAGGPELVDAEVAGGDADGDGEIR
jgi:hypothetical protein